MAIDPQQARLDRFLRNGLEMKKGVDALLEHVEQTYGLFHDAAQGWVRLIDLFESLVAEQVDKGLPRERVLGFPLIHGKGHPSDGVVLHRSTIGERIAACQQGGQNEVTLSNLCLISIYSFWEDKTRKHIANALGLEKEAVQSDLFGDIAKFRTSSCMLAA